MQLAGEPPIGDGPPGIGDNQGPSLEPPEIPPEEPASGGPKMAYIRNAIACVAQNIGRNAPAVSAYFEALDQVEQLNNLTAAIRSARDPARTLDELQDAAKQEGQKGYENHHIVNQHRGNRNRFGDERIDSWPNVVRVPYVKHIEISKWYSTQNDRYGRLSPRDFLRDKDWEEQTRVGLEVLREYGVLK